MTAAYIGEDISMKKLRRNALIIMCAAGMALTASCAAKVDEASEETVEQTAEESAAETTAALETAAPASEVSIAYEGIIDMLRAVRSGDADDDAIFDFTAVLSPDFMYVPEDESVYYTMIDVDRNGVDELLVYTHQIGTDGTETPVIYDAYTYRDGEPVHFIEGGVRNSYYLASDGTFYNMGSGGAAYTGFANYSYADGELTLTDCYFTDDSTGEVCWYQSNVGLWSDDKTEATEEEAMAFFEFEAMFIPNELEV